jgi:hypothetical protein
MLVVINNSTTATMMTERRAAQIAFGGFSTVLVVRVHQTHCHEMI